MPIRCSILPAWSAWRSGSVATLALLLLAGCGNPYRYEAFAPRVHPALGQMCDDHARIHTFYATDRRETGTQAPELRYGVERTNRLKLGSGAASIPASHGRGRQERPGLLERPDPGRHVLLLEVSPPRPDASFYRELCEAIERSRRREVLVYVHGFNTSFELACREASQIAHDVELDGAVVAYSWSSQALLLAYLVDANNVEWTEPFLVDFLERLVERGCAERIHLLAHSMGARALVRAVREIVRRRVVPGPAEFDQIILAAADIDAELFARDYAPYLTMAANRVTVYVSNRDWALRGSQRLHGYQRLGQWWPADAAGADRRRLDVIDVSAHDRGLYGHIYMYASPRVLRDIQATLRGVPAAQRGLEARENHYVMTRGS